MLSFGQIDVIGLSSLLFWPGCLVLGGKAVVFDVLMFWCAETLSSKLRKLSENP